jgi:hypothetical protein
MRSPSTSIGPGRRLGGLVGLTFGLLALAVPIAPAQDVAEPPQASEPAPQPPPPQPPAPSGVFESIGRWMDQGAANIRSQMLGAKERMDRIHDEAAANRREFGEKAAEVGKGAAEVTKGAVDAVVRLPGARVMSGRERCGTAPNGAPDCISAAEALCRKHGFASGRSMDFTSAEECPARALLQGRQSTEECRTVTFISRAMCQ